MCQKNLSEQFDKNFKEYVRQEESECIERNQSQKEMYYQIIRLADQAPWGISIMGSDYRFEYFNPKFTELFGYTLHNLPDITTWFQKAYPDLEYRRAIVSKWQYNNTRTEKLGRVTPLVSTVRCNNGEDKVVKTRAVAAIQGKHLLFYEDITEKRLTEKALRENEEKYKKLFNMSPDAVALVDEEGQFLIVNPSMSRTFGLTQEELEQSSFHEIMPVDSANRRLEKGKESIYKEKQVYFEDEIDQRYFQNFCVPVFISGEKRTFQIISRDVTESKQAEARLNYLSFHDSLTGLYNRNFFQEEINRLQDGRYSPVGIVVCDLDALKFVNDSLGHENGDKLIIKTADILRENFRTSDIIARIGGDEFAVLIMGTNQSMMESLVNRLRTGVERYNSQDSILHLSLSIGYAISEIDPPDMQALFKEADDKMYREKIQRGKSTRSYSIKALSKALETRDFLTEEHSYRLQDLTVSMARSLGFSENCINEIRLLARFHDLGKLGILDNILFKPGPLTAQEFKQMKKHSQIGQRLALAVPDLAPIGDWILKHHERWDGQGYPLGLKGKDIPLPCRILSIVDAYDAMISDRPYRKAMSYEEAISEIKKNSGTQFDPDLVEKFIWILEGSSEKTDPESI